MSALSQFRPATRAWFEAAFAAPTPTQLTAWAAISAGEHTLVVAPTGSGKTLAAFLWSLDRLAADPAPPRPPRGALRSAEPPPPRCRVLYISPLKALNVDVQRNLRAPLAGIGQAAVRLGEPPPDIEVALRSGDTSPEDRRAFARHGADILITTPESLFLLLTSAARDALAGVQTVIVDEIHALLPSKRGAHLALCLERLDELLPRPAQRIGLSATIRPVEEVATFLAGGREVTVVAPPVDKQVDLSVVVPVEDLGALGEPQGEHVGSAAGSAPRASIWPHVEERILDLVQAHRSTIVFANSRRLAERLTSRLNELAQDRADAAADASAEQSGDAEDSDDTDDTPRPRTPAAAPAQLMAQAGTGSGTLPGVATVAAAHHGSVSREQRAVVEEALKSGQLPAVVATSSLELGIDMGAVDLVIQVESPPTVAAGLQRVGRAGHQVGAVSVGVLFPKFRGDLLNSAVVAERMQAGQIESMRYLRNPLDVLAQQIAAMVALGPLNVDEIGALVRRSAPYTQLPESALHGVLDMLAGRYPSDAFAELRPRVTWDRLSDIITARAGTQRLAVTSGGTIPDRGMFGVFLIGEPGTTGRRVGELDEEMVYESRVGDVFLLGSSSWRIEDIGHDRVTVSPAPGQPGKMPFWHGDAPGRPLELGRALGAFLREVGTASGADERSVEARLAAAGLDPWARTNLITYLREQAESTGHLPDDRTLVVERFRDELGDWRLVVHSPFGAQVNAPWALVLTARLREQLGADVDAMHSDDGIVLRLPDTTGEPPSASLVLLEPDEVEAAVTTEVGGSALFAARFRECAARALLLPRRNPGKRTPLWQQRQRAAQLLGVASEYGSFPIVLETVREVLQDVYDVPGLVTLMREISNRTIRVVDVETPTASPFAQSLLFGYVGAFLYEGDAPLAERRAQALALDTNLLAELLGQADLRELLDEASILEVAAILQRLPEDRHPRDLDQATDVFRLVGDLRADEAHARGISPAWLDELLTARRLIEVRVAGQARYAAIEDAGRLRDALGVALPVGLPEAFTEPVTDPLADLVGRYARTHPPFTPAECARRLGLGVAVAAQTLARLVETGRITSGAFRPGGQGTEFCDVEVLRLIRRRSLAALRAEVEPVEPQAFTRFLPTWQGVGGRRSGVDGVLSVIEQLAGALIPASALETLVLPSRVRDYSPAYLDELTSSGEVLWTGAGGLPGSDGWVCFVPVDLAPLLLPSPLPVNGSVAEAVVATLDGGRAMFFRDLVSAVGSTDDAEVATALWDLTWAGRLTNDTLAPLRASLGSRPIRAGAAGGGAAGSAGRARGGRGAARYARHGRPRMPSRSGPPHVAGRWSMLPERSTDGTRRTHARAESLVERHGVLTRSASGVDDELGAFATLYPVLRGLEESGRLRRGYFIESLGAAQFGTVGAVDRLRATGPGSGPGSTIGARSVLLAAADPANPYGAALPWPARDGGHRPGRKAGSVVVLVDGELTVYVERGGKTLLSFTEDPDLLAAAAGELAGAARRGVLGRLSVQRADGESAIADSPLTRALEVAGFLVTPRGLRLRRSR